MKRYLRSYFTSWWMPTALALLVLAGLLGQEVVAGIHWLSEALAILFLLALVSILAAGIWQLAAKTWKKALLSLFLFLGTGAVSFVSIIFAVMLAPSEDGFGRDIVIPPDMALELPSDEWLAPDEGAKDAEGDELIGVFSAGDTASGNATLSVDLKIMNRFVDAKRGLLLRHLASSAKWFVTEERGKVYAYRRFVTEDGRWSNSLHGYYTAHDFDLWQEGYFQFRIVLGIDGPALDPGWGTPLTDVTAGSGKVELEIGESVNHHTESYLVLRSEGPVLEIYEDADTHARPLTALALSRIEAELGALWHSQTARTRGFDPALMPPESVKRGDPEIHLVQTRSGGGIYLVYSYLNPGEDGHVYLKVFEATRNTPLSERRIARRSTAYVGWSDDPGEVFFSNTQITVYEGDWGVFYPARFELWFVPASGGPERKLIEKIFKIEGWQR